MISKLQKIVNPRFENEDFEIGFPYKSLHNFKTKNIKLKNSKSLFNNKNLFNMQKNQKV